MKTHYFILFGLVVVLCVGSIRAEQLIYFTESPRGLYNFDTETGQSTLRCSMTGEERFFAMDRRPSDGMVFAVDLWGSGLWNIDTENGETTLIGTLNPTVDRPEGITFHPETGELFVSSVEGDLYKVDPDTAVTTLIGHSNLTINGHSFTPDGSEILAVRQGTGGLYSVDSTTASATYIGSGTSPNTTPEDTTFGRNGELFGTAYNGTIYRFNTETGEATLVGSTGYGKGLLGLITADVPEPSTLVLLSIGAISMLAKFRRRR